MRSVFFIDDSTENWISYYHLLFFMLSLPFDRFYSSVILMSFLIHAVIFFRKTALKRFRPETWLLMSVFLVTLLSSLYAPSFSDAMNETGKQLAIFLIPLIFSLISIDTDKYSDRLLKGFVFCCTLTILYLFFDAFHVIRFNKLPFSEIFSFAFVNQNFSAPIEMHATYLSMMLAVCLVWLLNQLFSGNRKERLLYIICALICFAGMIQLGSKSVLIATLVIINAGFPILVIKRKRGMFLCISLILSGLLLALILSVHIFRERYVITLKDDLHENIVLTEQHSRLDRWQVATDLIRHSPVIGVGAGSETHMLRDLYFERKMYDAYLSSLNAHNQYLGFMINTGLLGLLVFLTLLFMCFRRAWKRKNILLFGFTVLISIVCLSEDMLEVNKGIFFFAFFLSLFYNSGGRQLPLKSSPAGNPGSE